MPGYFIRPLETLYFGPPASFSAGEAHRGEGHFPPSPQAIQGLVRSHLLHGVEPSLDLNDWSEAARLDRAGLVGGPDDLPVGWQFAGPFPAEPVTTDDGHIEVRTWLPTPRYLLRSRSSKPLRAEVVRSTHLTMDDLSQGDADFLPAGAPKESAGEALSGWVSSDNLRWALAQDLRWEVDQHAAGLPEFVSRERQAGVEFDRKTRTAAAGMLFMIEAVRFRPGTGLIGWLEGALNTRLDVNCLNRGLAGAGRRRRPVAFESQPGPDPNWQHLQSGRHLPSHLMDGQHVWLVLVTPARIGDSIRPPLETVGGVRATIRAALLGPPTVIGGFSLETGKPRNNKTCVPAGSSWLVELSGGSDADRAATLRTWNGRCVWGDPYERAVGFGHVLVGLA